VDHQRLAVLCPLQRPRRVGRPDLWRPTPKFDFNFNDYGLGEDDAGFPGRSRVHADYSVQQKFYDNPKKYLDKIAWTITGDLGCEYGGGPAVGYYNPKGTLAGDGHADTYTGGVNCHNSHKTASPSRCSSAG
jgi:hypothetical protein